MHDVYIRFADNKTKPYRPCVFCGVTKSDITRYVLSAYKHEQEIINKKSVTALAQLRRYGITRSDAKILADCGTSSDLVCERKSVGQPAGGIIHV